MLIRLSSFLTVLLLLFLVLTGCNRTEAESETSAPAAGTTPNASDTSPAATGSARSPEEVLKLSCQEAQNGFEDYVERYAAVWKRTVQSPTDDEAQRLSLDLRDEGLAWAKKISECSADSVSAAQWAQISDKASRRFAALTEQFQNGRAN